MAGTHEKTLNIPNIREIQIKTTRRRPLTPARMAVTNTWANSTCWEDMEPGGPCTVGGAAPRCSLRGG